MSNYQRLISYIYTYEGGIKGKNTGFAKLETRNGQCRLTVNVKKIFVGGNPLGVYLLSGDGELRIGTLFARNGAGEFRAVLDAGNVEGSQKTLEEFYGLTIHDVESGWRTYTTVWEDAVAHAAAVDLAGVTAENVQKSRSEEENQSAKVLPELVLPISGEIEKELAREAAAEGRGAEPGPGEGDGTQERVQSEEADPFAAGERDSVNGEKDAGGSPDEPEDQTVQETEGEPVSPEGTEEDEEKAERVRTQDGGQTAEAGEPDEKREEQKDIRNEEAAPAKGADREKDVRKEDGEIVRQMEAAPERRESRNYSEEFVVMPGRRAVGPAAGELQRGIRARLIGRSVPPVNGVSVINKTSETGRDSAREPLAEQREQAAYGRPRSRKRPQESMSAGEWARQLNGKVIYGVGAGADRTQESGQTGREREEKGSHTQETEEFTPLELEEPDILSHQRMWARLRRKYPKILAFDYDDGCEILTIKPQDIGLLPREVWVFGNNSFLLHGYYSYRYLILARLENPEGEPRYLLGVPGHYHPNEKYMASMFGFPDFVLSKKQPSGDDCFGYWYTDIRVGE